MVLAPDTETDGEQMPDKKQPAPKAKPPGKGSEHREGGGGYRKPAKPPPTNREPPPGTPEKQ